MAGELTSIAERLAARCPSLLQVEPAVAAEAAVEMLALGLQAAALVTRLSGAASRVREGSLRMTHTRARVVGVTLAMVFPAGIDQFEECEAEIDDALSGWAPPFAATPFEYLGDQVQQYSIGRDGGRWLHLFRYGYAIQKTYEVQT